MTFQSRKKATWSTSHESFKQITLLFQQIFFLIFEGNINKQRHVLFISFSPYSKLKKNVPMWNILRDILILEIVLIYN